MATSKTLELLLSLRDEASAKMKSFGESIKDNSAIIKDVGKTMSLMGAAITGVSILAGTAAAKYNELKSANGELAKSFNMNSDEILTSLQLASKGTISNSDLIGSANRAMVLGVAKNTEDFTVLMQIARDRAQKMGMDTSQAFNDIVTGIGRGSPLILDNLGIILDAEQANIKYADSIGKTVEELTKEEKSQALRNAVIEQGKKTLDAASMANITDAERVRQLTATFDNLKITIGTKLLPAFVPLLEIVNNLMIKFSDWITKNPELSSKIVIVVAAIGGLLSVLGPILFFLPTIVSGFGVLSSIFAFIASPISILTALVGGFVTVFGTIVGVITAVLSPIGLIIGALVALGAVLFASDAQWNAMGEMIKNVWEGIKNFLFNAWNMIVEYAPIVWNKLIELISTAWNNLIERAPQIWNALMNIIVSIWNAIKLMVPVIWEAIKALIIAAWEALKAMAPVIWQGIKDAIYNSVVALMNSLPGIWQAIKNAAIALWQSLKTNIPIILYAIAKLVYDIHMDMFLLILKGMEMLKGWLSEKWNAIKASAIELVTGMITGIKDAFLNMVEGAKQWGANMIQGFVNGIKEKAVAAYEAVKETLGWIGKLMPMSPAEEGPLQNIVIWGQNVIKGFVEGMQTEKDNMVTSAETLLGSLEQVYVDSNSKIGEIQSKQFVETVDILNMTFQARKDLAQKTIDLEKSMKDEISNINKTGTEKVANLVVDSENKIVTIEDEIRELKKQKKAEDDVEKQKEIQKTINDKKKEIQALNEILNESKNFELDITKEVAKIKKRAGMSEIERITDDMKTEREIVMNKYKESMAMSQEETNFKIAQDLFNYSNKINVLNQEMLAEKAQKNNLLFINKEFYQKLFEMDEQFNKGLYNGKAKTGITFNPIETAVGNASSTQVNISGNTFMGTPQQFADEISQLLQKRLQSSLKF
jgi:phage-related protein